MARTVKVSDFENKAAAAVERARQGEEQVITARGRPVARLVPVPRRRNTPEQERALLEAHADEINADAAGVIAAQGEP